jgi:hypothetical protein
MPASSHKLARAIAKCVDEVIPPRFSVGAHRGFVYIFEHGVSLGGIGTGVAIDAEDGRKFSERAAGAAVTILGGIQDDVTLSLRTPWPADAAGNMALPGARTEAGRIYLWYGASEEEAVIRLRPIDLDDII